MLLLEWKWSMHSPCQERTFAKFPYFIRILKSIWFLLLLPHHANPTEVFPHILHHPLCTEYSRWLIWGPGMNKNYVKHALKSPQKFRTQDCSSANLLGSWHISGLKSKSYYEILNFCLITSLKYIRNPKSWRSFNSGFETFVVISTHVIAIFSAFKILLFRRWALNRKSTLL